MDEVALREALLYRQWQGQQHYGTTLRAFDGRWTLADAFQEAVDLSVYLAKEVVELRSTRSKGTEVLEMEAQQLMVAAMKLADAILKHAKSLDPGGAAHVAYSIEELSGVPVEISDV